MGKQGRLPAANMRVSFDLDDTLILPAAPDEADPCLPPNRRGYIEDRLRKGARDLMLAVAARGCEIWVYTNSFRGKQELLDWFAECRIPVANVINQQLHDVKRQELGMYSLRPAKVPPWFGIDLHVDDSGELEEDARRLGFRVVRVAPGDPDWKATVLHAVDALLAGKGRHDGPAAG